ncbi:hypothetical protein ACA910_004022 [Epithemia clementina (nom. ined.)]
MASQSQRELLIMAQNHMMALLVFLYGLYALCRFGFGWTPAGGGPLSSSSSVTTTVFINWNALLLNSDNSGIGGEENFFVILSSSMTFPPPRDAQEQEQPPSQPQLRGATGNSNGLVMEDLVE